MGALSRKTFGSIKSPVEYWIPNPGLIDIQINGAYGFDFSGQDYDEEAYQKGLNMVIEKIVETGVTSLVPTVVTQDRALYPNALQRLRPSSNRKSAAILGWHAEGPFLDSSKRGAHSPAWLADAPEGFKSIEETYGSTNVSTNQDWRKGGAIDGDTVGARIVTLAPEVQGILDAIEELTNRGIVVSMGHSAATSVVAMEAAKRGASLITHLFNAMPQLHHRDPAIIGLLGASSKSQRTPPIQKLVEATSDRAEALDSSVSPNPTPGVQGTTSPVPQFKRPFYTIIADGVHLHPQSIKMAYSTFPEGCVLMTDALHILDPHLKDGVHEWHHGKKVFKDGDKLYVHGTTTLCGSCVTLDKCVRNLTEFTEISLGEAIKCATFNPAKCLGIEARKGTLRPGADADLVVFDEHGIPQSTWIKGRKVWTQN
ncbi:N-acetyl-glucosamine-6-phosphate deacetylase [Marasmius tenuissimus]|uniref:N-acetylglucosamine-6-phosphate deacetylase n=1 Tax=Marasmius tenuissimus TaxID=585030 RepID=A0ABR3AHJ3_9AGAR